MLKTVMLVSAIAISAPALAQEAASPGQTPQSQSQTTPADTATPPAEQVTPTSPTTRTAESATTPAQAPTDQSTTQTAQTPAAPAGQAPATGAAQIAQVVNTEFPSYDKNADGNLDKTEFSSWLVALKTASDPTTKATDPATVTWANGAFASADTDKSSAVSKAELTTYLSQGAAS